MTSAYFISSGNFDLRTIKITQIQMMKDRGYEINDAEKWMLTAPPEEFHLYMNDLMSGKIDNEWVPYLDIINLPENSKYTYRSLLGNVYFKGDIKCLVVFIDQVGGQQVIKVIADAIVAMVEGIETGDKFDELILISRIPFSAVSKKCISGLRHTNHWIFYDNELMINVSRHKMVPEHRLMSHEDAIITKRTCKHLEQISEIDPVIKYYGWKVGGVVMIIRDLSELDMMVDKLIAKRVIVRSTAL